MRKDLIREAARLRGDKTYSTDRPCSRGNIADKLVSNGSCTCRQCKDARSALTRARYARKAGQIKSERIAQYWKDPGLARKKARDYRLDPQVRAMGIEACRLWRERNPGRLKELNELRKARNPEEFLEKARARHKKNPHIAIAKARKQSLAKDLRTPRWQPDLDDFVAQECYHLAKIRRIATGIEWHVDHLVPLRGRLASGLHCASNLQVIPASINRFKGNKLIMTEPFEWVQYV